MRSLIVVPLLLALVGVAPAPMTIWTCSGGIRSYELVEVASYDLTLRNTAAKAADEARVSVRYGRHDKRAAFDVKTDFPPGVDVKQHVRRTVSGGLYSFVSDQNDCRIDYVHYTDGTSWSRPEN